MKNEIVSSPMLVILNILFEIIGIPDPNERGIYIFVAFQKIIYVLYIPQFTSQAV